MKKRLDVLLVEKNLASSREKAKAVIMSGIVYVDGNREDKAGSTFDENLPIEVRGTTLKYVSRGGLKLEKAVETFSLDLQGKKCLDVGSSTGGFTDCMLQNGAEHVVAIDVGRGQLDWKLRNDPRVTCMEKTNIRYVLPEDIPYAADFSSIDVSFISLVKVLLPVRDLLCASGRVVCTIGYTVLGLDYSPIKGPEGNIEYLAYLEKGDGETADKSPDESMILRVVDEAHSRLDKTEAMPNTVGK